MKNVDNTIDLEDDDDDDETFVDPKQNNLKRKKVKSDVWQHFIIPDPVLRDNPRTWCRYCNEDYAYKPSENGTSSLRGHLSRCKKYPNRKEDKRQKTLVFDRAGGVDGVTLNAVSFNKEMCRKALARMIIVDELAFRFVEKEGFVNFCSTMQQKFEVPRRLTIARDIMSLYGEEKKKLKSILSKSSRQVGLTTDAWSSIQNVSYMVLTVHYVDDDCNLQKRILNFETISNLKGETIGKMIEACLFCWGIERVLTITVDNASSNDVAITYMKKRSTTGGMEF